MEEKEPLVCIAIITLYDVCSVHWGMFSTLGDIIEYTIQYSGVGIPRVHRRYIISTVGAIISAPWDAQHTRISIQI